MTRIAQITGLMLVLGACSSGTPRNLADARAAYQRAAQGPAAQLTPAQLHVAQTSLALAEKTFEDEGDSANARDRAYVAQRKAELAEIQAAVVAAEQRAANAARLAELNRTRNQLATQQSLSSTQAQLAAEQQRRLEAEKRTAETMAQLASFAAVKQEQRGTVITLSGSVIFPSAKAELLPAARAKLDQVATALKKSEPDAKFVVEGHTDSRGSEEMNQELSAKRAAAVRDYLVSQGVSADRIVAVGRGPAEPVADNKTAEGRANNRRVEIVVQGQQQLAAQDQRATTTQQGAVAAPPSVNQAQTATRGSTAQPTQKSGQPGGDQRGTTAEPSGGTQANPKTPTPMSPASMPRQTSPGQQQNQGTSQPPAR